MKYRVWDEDTYGQSEENSPEFECDGLKSVFRAQRAVEKWLKKLDHSDGYPDGQEVFVREVETNRLYVVTITTDFDPIFYCRGRRVEYIDGKLTDI